MQGYNHALLATLTTLLLANAVFSQEIAPVSAPTIVNVTPGDSSGVIGFIPSRVTEGTPAVREYVISCDIPGKPDAGVIETTAEVTALIGNNISIQGLLNGESYQCTMIGRAVRGGLVPRAINSDPSNPSPIFTPSSAGGPTIFVNAPGSDGNSTILPATESQSSTAATTTAPRPETTAAVEPPTTEQAPIVPNKDPVVVTAPVVDVPTPMPTTPPVEEQKDAPISSAVRVAASAIVASVFAVAFAV